MKIPLNSGGKKLIAAEWDGMKRASISNSHRILLPQHKKVGPAIVTSFLSEPAKDLDVENWLRSIKLDSPISLREILLKFPIESFVEQELGSDRASKMARFLENTKYPKSHSHGDFHHQNVFNSNGLKAIDWEYFSENSSAWLDWMDFQVVKPPNSWFENLNTFLLNPGSQSSPFAIQKEHWIGYGIWKTAKDLKQLQILFGDKLPDQKRIKYIRILKELIDLC
ncbi:MAG: hypothetical protein KDD25_09410 [Bdellovibrionales bacterium]|nr:hypothetical protein [Bdellovibrionales bacterium]